MSFKNDLKQLIKPYYVFNIILSLSYIFLKKMPGVCDYLFGQQGQCEFNGRETEILFFLLIVVMIRTRKTGSVTMIHYLSASFIYTKVANMILWFNADLIMGIVYTIIFILGALLLPEPAYSGPDNVIYFNGLSLLEDELNRNRKTTWLIAFYTVWSPACVNMAPVFAELSNAYSADGLKFGKVDVGRFPTAAKKYNVNEGSTSSQLPTLVLFADGKEVMRRPMLDAKGKYVKFGFTKENIVRAFDLKGVLEKCKVDKVNVRVKND